MENLRLTIYSMNHRDEAALLKGARNFDKAILTEIYDLYNPGLFAYAYRLTGESSTAEECVSETFTRFLKALQNGGGPNDHIKAYLYKVAHNLITDIFRREPIPPEELDEQVTVQQSNHIEEQAEMNLELSKIRRAMQNLTEDQRQVIVLRFLEGWDIQEVAAVMNRPDGAVKSLQHRGLAALQKMLEIGEVMYDKGD